MFEKDQSILNVWVFYLESMNAREICNKTIQSLNFHSMKSRKICLNIRGFNKTDKIWIVFLMRICFNMRTHNVVDVRYC